MASLIEADGASLVIARLNRHNLEQMTASGTPHADELYKEHALSAPRLLRAISSIPHLVLLHEDIGLGRDWKSEAPAGWLYEGEEYDETLSEATRASAFELFDRCGVQPTFYRRNAEADELAVLFVDDISSNLLLRIYIPSGAVFGNEAAGILDMFRDWLVTTQRVGVRRAGYRTTRGEVVEFYADSSIAHDDIVPRFEQFQRFVDLLSDADAALESLMALGFGPDAASEFIARNVRALRRLRTDLRHDYERRLLALRQAAEAEVVEEVDTNVPFPTVESAVLRLFGGSEVLPRIAGIEIPGTVVSDTTRRERIQIEGVQEGQEPRALMAAVEAFDTTGRLATMVHDIEDLETPRDRRSAATAALKSFLIRSRDRIESEGFKVLFRWIEYQAGL